MMQVPSGTDRLRHNGVAAPVLSVSDRFPAATKVIVLEGVAA